MGEIPPDVRTTYLGQFTREHGQAIGERLEEQRIVWWFKQPGFLSRLWERGVRLFVDRARLEEARQIVAEVLGRATEG
jgi:hypothetical protein